MVSKSYVEYMFLVTSKLLHKRRWFSISILLSYIKRSLCLTYHDLNSPIYSSMTHELFNKQYYYHNFNKKMGDGLDSRCSKFKKKKKKENLNHQSNQLLIERKSHLVKVALSYRQRV